MPVLNNTISSGPLFVTLTIKSHAWFSINKLYLNLGKTNYMLFRGRPPDLELHLKINNAEIPKVTATKFLGIVIDDRLNGKPHIQSVKSK